MRYGVSINNRGPGGTTANIIAAAQRADQLGYTTVWVSDHVVVPEQFSSHYPYGPPGSFSVEKRKSFYEPLMTLAYVAGATRGVRLGTSVLVAPQREPVLTGKMLATLDALSGGRVVVGVGAGWLREEFEALGTGALFDERGPALDECIQLWKALWTQETSSFQGRVYSLPPVRAFPKPAQRPHPPILVGGNGRPARRRAARLGDGWHAIDLPPNQLRAAIADLRALAVAAGRRPEDVPTSVRVRVRLGAAERKASDVGGSPAEVRAQLAALEEMGVAELNLDFTDFSADSPGPLRLDALERFAELVGLPPRG
ncbi:MAG: TIGR03619 family F420-dependent LLM class oxidoreductase [Chloroflexi bacterium]|nr:TIGR03619 family F420-dependent LLM class oxidoreductase [Chloroflexota bacterium]